MVAKDEKERARLPKAMLEQAELADQELEEETLALLRNADPGNRFIHFCSGHMTKGDLEDWMAQFFADAVRF